MLEQWYLWIFIILIIVAFIIVESHVPKRCNNCTYFYGNRCDRCYKDNESDVID